MARCKPDIKRGPMTPAEKAEIDRLAETLRKPTPSAVASRLNRHVATVFWYMLNKGYLERRLRYSMLPYQRRGKMIYPYTRAEDLRMLALRVEGRGQHQIAKILSAEFDRQRTAHGIDVRLRYLAACENSPEDLAA